MERNGSLANSSPKSESHCGRWQLNSGSNRMLTWSYSCQELETAITFFGCGAWCVGHIWVLPTEVLRTQLG
eukprot:5684297-Amphidinium_carterae.1